MSSLTRRQLLAKARQLAVGALLAPAACRAVGPHAVPGDPFLLGVTSGEPAPDGFVIWTRVEPVPFGPVPPREELRRLTWEVAEDPGFRRVARKEQALARPERAHCVHVEVGGLAPGRPYWYRFRAGDAESPVGRAATAPAPGAPLARLRFAAASCQNYEFVIENGRPGAMPDSTPRATAET